MIHFMLETVLTTALLGVDPYDRPAFEAAREGMREHLGRVSGGMGRALARLCR